MRDRLFSILEDPAWETSEPGTRNIFWPALDGLPGEHAVAIALLPIHDANGLLLDAIDRAARWPEGGWACIFAADPFRAPQDILGRLKRRGVRRVCCFTASSVFGAAVAEALDRFGMASDAESELARWASELELEFGRLDHRDVSVVESRAAAGPSTI